MPLGSAPISIGAGPRLEALYFFLQHREGQLLSVFPLFFTFLHSECGGYIRWKTFAAFPFKCLDNPHDCCGCDTWNPRGEIIKGEGVWNESNSSRKKGIGRWLLFLLASSFAPHFLLPYFIGCSWVLLKPTTRSIKMRWHSPLDLILPFIGMRGSPLIFLRRWWTAWWSRWSVLF